MNLTARLLALCVIPACGGDAATNIDGGLDADGSVTVDGRPAAVTIHVFDAAHAPAVGRAVAFLKADDSIVAETITDSTGTATASMPDGGSVTVAASAVVSTVGQPVAYTYLGVKNGDELTIGNPTQASSPFSITVRVLAGAVPTAQNYLFNSSCNINASNETNTLSTTMMLHAGCTAADFYIEAKNNAFKTISTAWRAAQPVSAGATVDSGTTFTAPTTSTFSVSNASQFAAITPALDLVVGAFYPVPVGFNSELTLSNGAGSRTLTHAVIPGSSLETRIQIDDVGAQLVVKRAAAPASVALNLSTANLPSIASGVVYSAASSAVKWQESGQAVDTAAVDIQVKNGTARNFRWLIVGPHTGASLRVPHLPASLTAFNIAAGDVATPRSAAIGSFPGGGYDRIRAHVFVSELDFFSPFQGGGRRNGFDYVLADGDTAMIASNR